MNSAVLGFVAAAESVSMANCCVMESGTVKMDQMKLTVVFQVLISS